MKEQVIKMQSFQVVAFNKELRAAAVPPAQLAVILELY
jgi:hypothetical protein